MLIRHLGPGLFICREGHNDRFLPQRHLYSQENANQIMPNLPHQRAAEELMRSWSTWFNLQYMRTAWLVSGIVRAFYWPHQFKPCWGHTQPFKFRLCSGHKTFCWHSVVCLCSTAQAQNMLSVHAVHVTCWTSTIRQNMKWQDQRQATFAIIWAPT